MDFLSDDLLINISTRVAAHSMHDLFYFQRINKTHAAICREAAVSRAFGNDVIALLTDLSMTHAKLDFMNRLWSHGNHMFCILRCSQQLLHAEPRFDVINALLTNVVAAHSLSTKYFHVLVKATAYPLENEAQLLNDFWFFVMTRNLHNYRLDILGGDTSFRFRCTRYKRYMPIGMIRRCFCNNWVNCARDGRRGNYRGFLPADDEEYAFNHFCLRCRLNEEVRWLIEVFGIGHQWH